MPVAEADQTQSDADLAKQYGGVVEAPQYNLTISDADLAKQYGGTVGETPAAPTAPQEMLEAVSQKFGGGKAFKDQTPETQQELLKIGNLMVSQGKSAGDVAGMVPPGTPAYPVTPGTPATPPSQEPTTALGEVKNFGKQIGSQLFQGYGNVAHLSANIYGLLDAAADKISQLTGTEKGGFFKEIEDYARGQQQAAEKTGAELAGGRQDLPSNITRAVSGMVFNLPTYAAATAAGGPIGGMAMLGALEAADQGWKNQLHAALEGALQGGLMHVIGPGGRMIRFTVPMLTTYKMLRDQGADWETAASNALTMGGISGIPAGGTGVRQMIRNVPQLPGQIAESIIPERYKITPQLNPIEQASQQYLTQHDIQTPLSMQTGSPAAQQLEASTGRSPGGGAFGRQLEESKQKLVRVGQEQELPRIHPEPVTEEEAGAAVGGKLARDLEQTRSNLLQEVHDSPTTPEAAGQSVIDKGQQIIQQFNQQANDAYDTAWQRAGDPRLTKQVPVARDSTGGLVMGDVNMPVDIRWLKDIARQELPNLELLPAATQAQKAAVSIYRAVLAAKDYVPARWAENALSGLKEEARGAPSPEERSYSQGVAAGVIPKLQAGIDAAVAEAGPEALAGLRAGRAATAQKYGVSDLFRKFGRDINELEPVQVFNRMTWGRDTGIDQLRAISQIAPEEMPAVGRAFIEGGGNWSELGPETKKILFHGDQNLISDLDQYHADLARFGPLTKLEPVALFDRLTRPEARTINQLRAVAKQAPEEMAKLGRAFVQGLLEKATREGDLGKVQSILNKWLDLDAQSKGILFEDPALVHDLDKFFFSLKRMMANPNPSGSGFMMGLNQLKGRLMTGAGLTAGGAFTGNLPSFLGGLGVLGSAGLEVASNAWLARKLFDPRFIRLVTKGIDMQNRGNVAGSRLVAGQVLKDFPPDQEPPEGPPTGGGGAPPPGTPPAGAPPGVPPAGGGAAAPEGTGLKQAGGEMGQAITKNMYDMLWGKVQSGDVTEAGGPSPLLRGAKVIKQAGGMKSIDEFRQLASEYAAIPRDQNFANAWFDVVDRHLRGAPPNPPGAPPGSSGTAPAPGGGPPSAEITRETGPEEPGSPLYQRLQGIGDAALERIRQRGSYGGRFNALPIPDMKDITIWAASRIGQGVVDPAALRQEIINQFKGIPRSAVREIAGRARDMELKNVRDWRLGMPLDDIHPLISETIPLSPEVEPALSNKKTRLYSGHEQGEESRIWSPERARAEAPLAEAKSPSQLSYIDVPPEDVQALQAGGKSDEKGRKLMVYTPGESPERATGLLTEDVQRYLEDMVRKRLGEIPEDAPDSVKMRRLLRYGRAEFAEQLRQPYSGVEWYGPDTAEGDRLLRQVRPELADPDFDTIQKAMSAAMSNNSNPQAEAFNGARIWEQAYNKWKRNPGSTLQFPELQPDGKTAWPAQGATSQIQKLNQMIQELGVKGTADFLRSKVTGADIKHFVPNASEIRLKDFYPGAKVLGPKIGVYFNQIMNIPVPGSVVDVWMMRRMGRILGNLFDKNGTVIEAPRTEGERNLSMDLDARLAREHELATRDAQSVGWHYEQELYRRLGLDVKSFKRSDGIRKYLESLGFK